MIKKYKERQQKIKPLTVVSIDYEKDSTSAMIRKIDVGKKKLAFIKSGQYKICSKCGKKYRTIDDSYCLKCKKVYGQKYYQERKGKNYLKEKEEDNILYITYDYVHKKWIYIGETTKFKNRYSDYLMLNTAAGILSRWLVENNRSIKEFFICKFDLKPIMNEFSSDPKEFKKYRKALEQYLEIHLPHEVHTNRKNKEYNETLAEQILEKLLATDTYEIEYAITYGNSNRKRVEPMRNSILQYLRDNEIDQFRFDEEFYDKEPLLCKVIAENKSCVKKEEFPPLF